ncbi:MAG: aminopeptidase N, partial [Alteromonadaceae bacterium]
SQFAKSDNMTDTLAVLSACNNANNDAFFTYMTEFEQKWRDDALVMDKWFGLHASWSQSDVFKTMLELYKHPAFNIENPNRVRAIIGVFSMANSKQFHDISGMGYQVLTDVLIKLNEINPQTASRLLTPLMSFKRYDATRQKLMREQLQRLADLPNLSKDLYEKVSQSLS